MKHISVRAIAILIVSVIIFYKIYLSLFEYSMLDIIVWSLLCIVGFMLFIRTIYKESKAFTKDKKWYNFQITIICILIAGLAVGFKAYISSVFAKSSLLIADYHSEYLVATIDFKKDGSFIFDSGGLGDGKYVHGEYTIDGNSFVLNKNIDYIIYTKRLDVVELQEGFRQKPGIFLVQIDKNMKITETSLKFPVIFDGRKHSDK